MSGRRSMGGLTASPVLVGATTLLVAIVAVFLSYNANSGLPFVPTYDIRANLPNAANLVEGNEVRIGGARVGVVAKIEPQASSDGAATAQVTLKLDQELEPLPVDTTLLVRPKSALGLKYVELYPGTAGAGYEAGAVIPLRQATPDPVELDDVLNTFSPAARRGAQQTLTGFGSGLAGRGQSLNVAIEELNPLLRDLRPVAANLADPKTRLDRLFPALGATADEVAPVAGENAALFSNLDRTFAALAAVARPYIQDSITETPPTLQKATAELPRQRAFLRNSAALFRELRPGVATLPASAPLLADALAYGTRTLPQTPALNRRLARVFDSLAEFAEDPLVPLGVRRLRDTIRSLRPTVAFLAPAQTKCNYVTLWFRNVSSVISQGDSNGTWQRFIIIAAPVGPNSEQTPSAAPANGPTVDNHLHANPYPNHGAPGQTKECEAGNEDYMVGKTTIGNLPGNQGLKTSGQDGPSISSNGAGR